MQIVFLWKPALEREDECDFATSGGRRVSESEAWRVAMLSEDFSSGRLPVPMRVDIMRDAKKACSVRAEEVCEKRSGREGLPVANNYP